VPAAVRAVLFDGSLTPTARLLYAYLHEHGPCTIGYRRLTRETGCGREALETGIALLELRKLITLAREPRRATTYTAIPARRNDVGIAVPDRRAAEPVRGGGDTDSAA
jgi:hypothetical protein